MKSNQENNFNLKTILKGFLNNLNIQRGFIRTLIDLIIRPNYVFKYYIEGNRGKHFSPARYFITIISFFGIIKILFPTYLDNEFLSLSDFAYLEGKLKAIVQFFNKTPLIYVFIFIIPFSIVSRIVFYDSNKNFAMHLIANIYTASSSVIITMFVDGVFTILSPEILETDIFQIVMTILVAVYYIYCYSKFLGLHPLYGFLKIGVAAAFTILLIAICTTYTEILLIRLTGNQGVMRMKPSGLFVLAIPVFFLLLDWGINKYRKKKKSG